MRTGSLALLVALAACGGAATEAKAPIVPPTVTLLDAGAGPRQRVQFELAPHMSERVEMTNKMYVATAFENTVLETGQRKSELPLVRVRGHVEVTDVTPDGTATIAFAADDITVDGDADPRVRQAVEAELRRSRSVQGTWRMSRSGVLTNVALEEAKGATGAGVGSVTAALATTTVAFPEADIGVGATWQVVSQPRTGGIHWTTTSTCKLLSLDNGVATVDVSVASRAGSQALFVEPKRSRRLTSGAATSSGQVIIPLKGLVPTTAMRGTSETNFQIVEDRRRIASTITIDSVLSINPLRP
ncbi:MAG: hypothetical protein HOV81_17295 [Kofleriaceae bacterium]|nr:hypothetical protein [Kofleriaceae bacterium]